MNRLGVFVFYDPQGIVDDYVLFLLREMRKVCAEIVTVCNGKLTAEGKKLLSEYSGSIFCRENRGMDAGALKDYFTNLGAWEYWSSFDELVWFNDTCYGPLYGMDQVFAEMERREACDFWGMTVHAKSNAKWPGRKESGIGEHLQSYFIVVKNPLLRDLRFLQFWKEMHISDKFNETVANYELSLTETFASWGYTYAALCDTRTRDTNPDCVCNPTADAMYLLVSRYACPFVKRKNFIRTYAEATVHTNGEQVTRTMRYIQSKTNYDTALIYRNLMRLYDESMWQSSLCLSYSLPSECSPADGPSPASLIIAEINHEDTAIELADILTGLPDNCDLVIATDSSALVPIIEGCMPSCLVTVVPEMRRGMVSLFQVLKQLDIEKYGYFCVLSETWGEPSNDMHIPESSIRFSLWGNLVGTPHFIRNVLRLFEENPCLGILEPPVFPQSRNMKTVSFPREQMAADYGIRLPCKLGDGNAYSRSSLWCRKEVILSVLEKLSGTGPIMDSQTLACLVGDIALESGFYSAEVMEERQAACILEEKRQLETLLHKGAENTKLLHYRQLFQKVAMINSGACAPEEANVTPSEMRKLIIAAALFYVEKRVNPSISQEKRDTFFLGIRDVCRAYRRLKKPVRCNT